MINTRLKNLLRAAGIEFSGKPALAEVFYSPNPRAELFLPFLIDCPARLDELAALANVPTASAAPAASVASRRKAQRTIQALFYLLEWGSRDPVYGPRLTALARQMKINCGGTEKLLRCAEKLGLQTEAKNSCALPPYPRRYLKLAAALGAGNFPGENPGWRYSTGVGQKKGR